MNIIMDRDNIISNSTRFSGISWTCILNAILGQQKIKC